MSQTKGYMSNINANSLIETTIDLKILNHPRKYDDFMQFTKRFNQHFKEVSRSLSADPATDHAGTREGSSFVVLNYLGLNKINEDLVGNDLGSDMTTSD